MTAAKRKSFSRASIAQYWIEYERANKACPPWGDFDWGEPACMAGGLWNPTWDDPKTIAGRWNKSSLEKCHVVPLHLGGLDDVSNMVLMCSACHDGQPDSVDPEVTYAYMRERNLFDCHQAQGAIATGLLAVMSGKSTDEAVSVAVAKFRTDTGRR